MARGDVATTPEHAERCRCATTSGRIRGSLSPGTVQHYLFPIGRSVALDDALTYSSGGRVRYQDLPRRLGS